MSCVYLINFFGKKFLGGFLLEEVFILYTRGSFYCFVEFVRIGRPLFEMRPLLNRKH